MTHAPSDFAQQSMTTLPCHDESEATLRQPQDANLSGGASNESCLVQIYPPDVVNGMLMLESDRLTVGRDRSAGLRLPDSSVSRIHAEFVRDESGFIVHDLGSTNGTHVNGDLIEQQRLQSGDTIRLGSFLFKYLCAGCVETQFHETVYTALTRDALTGTMNKRFLLESMQREVARAVRQRCVLSVLMLDIDHFKSVNDTYGHDGGDDVLRQFADRLRKKIRGIDLICRFGGEEFVIIMPDTSAAIAAKVAERMRLENETTPFLINDGQISLKVTASAGVAGLDFSNDSVESLMKRADLALYEAKSGGRNRVVTKTSDSEPEARSA